MASDFTLDPRWKEHLMEALRPQIQDKCERGLSASREAAPVDTGEYKASLHLESTGGGYNLIGGSDHAAIVEYGTLHQHGYRVLGIAQDIIARS